MCVDMKVSECVCVRVCRCPSLSLSHAGLNLSLSRSHSLRSHSHKHTHTHTPSITRFRHTPFLLSAPPLTHEHQVHRTRAGRTRSHVKAPQPRPQPQPRLERCPPQTGKTTTRCFLVQDVGPMLGISRSRYRTISPSHDLTIALSHFRSMSQVASKTLLVK